MAEEIVLVDLFDRETGYGEKLKVHRERKLHRAFSPFSRISPSSLSVMAESVAAFCSSLKKCILRGEKGWAI